MTLAVTSARPEHPIADYGPLLAEVRRAGLLDRSALNYVPRLLVLTAMAAAGVVALFWLGNTWWQLGIAAYLGGIFAQVGFLGHDAGHQQVFRRKRLNDAFGLLLSTLGVGLSYGWWVDKHNRHHRNPNEVGRDPDVERNILAWTHDQAESQRGFFRFVARHQDAYFFPLLLLEGWNLHVGSVRALISRPKGRALELTLLAIHAAGAVALLLVVLPPTKAIAFVAIQQSVFGLYLGSSFAPNHKGMALIDATNRPDFLRRQVLTSRNIAGGRLLTAAFGGLNYQIEHHLFPSMPSRNLRRCQPFVKGYCAAHGVNYSETTLWLSYRQSLRYLRSIAPGKAALLHA
jgi:fatty acid desaturase